MDGEVAQLFVTVKAITAQFNAAMDEVNGRIGAAAKKMSAAGESISKTGRTMTREVTLPILGVAAAGAKMALDFHAQMQLIQTQAGGSAQDVKKLTSAVEEMAQHTTQGPEELAKGLYHLKSLGLDNATALKVLKQAANGATVGMTDLEDTANALGGAVRTNIAGAKNYSQAMGTINATVGAGNMRMGDLVAALGTGILPTAKLAGLSLRGVGAAMATMTDENVPAVVAATRLRTGFMMMQAPSKQAEKAMESMGFTSKEVGDKIRSSGGIVSAIQMISDHYEAARQKVGKTQAFADMAKAFGGSKAASTVMMLANNIGVLRQKYEQIGNTAGHFNKAVAAAQENQLNRLKAAWASMQVALIQVGDIVVPIFARIVAYIAKVTTAFEQLNPHVQKVIVVAALIVAAVGPMLTIFGKLVSLCGLVAKGIELVGSALEFASANPIVGIIAALVLVGVALYELYEHCATFRDMVGAAFNATATVVRAAMGVIREVVSAVVDYIEGVWRRNGAQFRATADEIKATATAAWHAIEAITRAVWPVIESIIRTAATVIRSTVTAGFNGVKAIATAVWPVISAIVKAAWAVIKAVVSTDVRVILDVVRTVMAVLRGDWGDAWNNLKKLCSDAVHGIVNVISAVLHGAISIAAAAASSIGSAILHGILAGVSGLGSMLASKVKSEFSSALGAVKGFLGIHSPSRVMRDQIGKPLADGVVQGYMDGSAVLPTKIAHSMRTALESGKAALTQERGAIATAFSHLLDNANQTFALKSKDAMNQLTQQYDDAVSKIDAKLKSKLASLASQAKAPTVADRAVTALQGQMQGEQNAHDLAAAQDQVSSAQTALNQAQSDAANNPGDQSKQQAVIDAQKQLNDALYQLQQTQEQQKLQLLQQQAQQDDAARDAIVKQKEAKAKAQAAKEKAAVKAHYEQRKADLAAELKLEKTAMDNRLKALEKQLAKDPAAWAKEHRSIMKLFSKTFGPDMRDSGTKLGKMFAQGIRSSFGEIAGAAHDAAAILERYLRLHSPAKEGPLSQLDRYWTAFAPTLLSGLDVSAIRAAVAGAVAAPALALAPVAVASTPARTAAASVTAPTALRAGGLPVAGPLVNIERVEMNNGTDVELAATHIGREIESRLGR